MTTWSGNLEVPKNIYIPTVTSELIDLLWWTRSQVDNCLDKKYFYSAEMFRNQELILEAETDRRLFTASYCREYPQHGTLGARS